MRNSKGQFSSTKPRIAIILLLAVIAFLIFAKIYNQQLVYPCADSGCVSSTSFVQKAQAYEHEPLPQNKALYETVKNDPIRKEIYMTFGQSGINVAVQSLAIAQCESGMRPTAKNGVSTASGLFQFIDGTWISTRKSMGKDQSLSLKLNASENIQTAYVLYKRSGWNPWECKKVLGI